MPRIDRGAELVAVSAMAMAEDTRMQQAAPGEALTVLVVDDEPLVAMLIIDVLSELGYIALHAADGRVGREILQSGRAIDLMITDIGLPGTMNGRQLAEIALQGRPGLKILFVTGYADRSLAATLPLGSKLINKPFSIDTLANTVAAMVAAMP